MVLIQVFKVHLLQFGQQVAAVEHIMVALAGMAVLVEVAVNHKVAAL
jgi:hypothetical protein